MDPARSRKAAKRAPPASSSAPSAASTSTHPTPYPARAPPSSRPPPVASAPSATITSLPPPPTGHDSKGSFPSQTSIPSSFPRPARPGRPPPREKQVKPAKPENSSLVLAKQEMPRPLPCKATYPNLVRLDLGSMQGEGVFESVGGVGWIGKEWGSQLTWLCLSGNEELGKAGEGWWDGFGLLRELIVLNVSSCKMSALPEQFASLSSLKAFVATGNEFEELDPEIVGKWTDLNSLIMSQNPLRILPSSLPTLTNLAKLSASHTRLSTSSPGLPDLSPLPLLRMLSLSHNPDITSLPKHFSSWGTGILPASDSANARPNNISAGGRRGDGLEVVELGGCGLDKWEGLRGLMGGHANGMKGLRSLGLRGCGVTKLEGYADRMNLLLPTLQILDNTRIVERKAKRDAPAPAPAPEPVEEASPSPEPQPKPKRTAITTTGKPSKRAPPAPEPEPEVEQPRKRKRKSRAAGGDDEDNRGYGFDVKTSTSAAARVAEEEQEDAPAEEAPTGKKRKRSRKAKAGEDEPEATAEPKRNPPSATGRNVKKVVAASTPAPAPEPTPAPAPIPAPAPAPKPKAAVVAAAPDAPKPVDKKKTETSVLKIVEVPGHKKGKKGKQTGVDLVELFGGKKKELGGGLGEGGAEGGDTEDPWGVGGWD